MVQGKAWLSNGVFKIDSNDAEKTFFQSSKVPFENDITQIALSFIHFLPPSFHKTNPYQLAPDTSY